MFSDVFVNLPVKDLKKSMAFFDKLGFSFDPRFTNDDAACMIIGERMHCMLVCHERFKDFIPGSTISNATKATEVLIALGCESRARVDECVRLAVGAGGTTFRPANDHGFMYEHAFKDLDGHVWEPFWMQASE